MIEDFKQFLPDPPKTVIYHVGNKRVAHVFNSKENFSAWFEMSKYYRYNEISKDNPLVKNILREQKLNRIL